MLRGELRTGATQWFREQSHLLVPARDDPEGAALIATALAQLAVAEERSPQEVASDVRARGADRLLITVSTDVSEAAERLPLTVGVTLLESVRDLLIAAAVRAARPVAREAAESRRWRDAFISRVELDQTAEGSYTVPIVFPESVQGPVRVAASELAREFGRRVAIELASMLRGVRELADSEQVPPSNESGWEAVEPIVRLLERLPGGGADFRIEWSRLRPPTERVTRQIGVDSSDLPRLADVSRIAALGVGAYAERRPTVPELQELVEEQSFETFVLHGKVIALRRPAATVEGDVLGQTRRVRVLIDDERLYRRAIQAFAESQRVGVVGRLTIRPHTASVLEAVTALELE